jgi:hypothetical protein
MTVYKVTGPTAFRGHEPGEEFEDELSPEQEKRAKARGSIRVVKRADKDDKKEEEDA